MKRSPGYHAHIIDKEQTTSVQQTNLFSNIMLSTRDGGIGFGSACQQPPDIATQTTR
jgi:hypothetical protein